MILVSTMGFPPINKPGGTRKQAVTMERYHLRRREKEIGDAGTLNQILARGRYATIAMCRDDEPYLVTLSYGFDPLKNALYFHTGPVGLKIDFLKANPAVCATVIEDGGYLDGECDHRYRSVVINGKVAFIKDVEEKKHGLEIMFSQLEENPDPIRGKLLKKENPYGQVNILRLDIVSMIGKKQGTWL
jgi:uncharacterized protein